MLYKILNFIAFQLGWFACVLGAANGRPGLGPVVVAGLLAAHLAFIGERTREVTLLIVAAAIGYVFDSALVLTGVMSFPDAARFGGPTTVWMVFMWMNFSATLHASLQWLIDRYLIGAAFGLVGGPLAYYAGMKFGAVELGSSLPVSLSAIAIEWAIATPLLLWVAKRTAAPQRNDVPASEAHAAIAREDSA